MVKKHPDVKAKGAAVDMTDLELDPFVMFQKKLVNVLRMLLINDFFFCVQTLFVDDASADFCHSYYYSMVFNW